MGEAMEYEVDECDGGGSGGEEDIIVVLVRIS